MEKCEVLHFGGIQRLSCRAVSASAEFLFRQHASVFLTLTNRYSNRRQAALVLSHSSTPGPINLVQAILSRLGLIQSGERERAQ